MKIITKSFGQITVYHIYIGIPFVVIGHKILDCHRGIDRNQCLKKKNLKLPNLKNRYIYIIYHSKEMFARKISSLFKIFYIYIYTLFFFRRMNTTSLRVTSLCRIQRSFSVLRMKEVAYFPDYKVSDLKFYLL